MGGDDAAGDEAAAMDRGDNTDDKAAPAAAVLGGEARAEITAIVESAIGDRLADLAASLGGDAATPLIAPSGTLGRAQHEQWVGRCKNHAAATYVPTARPTEPTGCARASLTARPEEIQALPPS